MNKSKFYIYSPLIAIAPAILLYIYLERLAGWFVFTLLSMPEESRLAETIRFFIYEAPKVILLLTVIVFAVGVSQRLYHGPKLYDPDPVTSTFVTCMFMSNMGQAPDEPANRAVSAVPGAVPPQSAPSLQLPLPPPVHVTTSAPALAASRQTATTTTIDNVLKVILHLLLYESYGKNSLFSPCKRLLLPLGATRIALSILNHLTELSTQNF